MPKKAKSEPKDISLESYSHSGKKRKNNPPVGLVSSATDRVEGKSKYEHDPHIDPYLSWAGKKEGNELEVRDVSLHIHERIDPKRIVKSFLKKSSGTQKQLSLFQEPVNEPPLNKAIDFYSHDQDWTNRLIAGDSLLVMNSLLQKEGMAGKIQMIYIDPPYGIKYNSNFQPFVNKRDVKDNNDADIPAEPEMIQAFRDTWELGIHSYLTYLRDRLLLAKNLLHESGACFVQISNENVHHVKEIMDEIFTVDNFVEIIVVQKTSFSSSNYLPGVADYILFYAKDKVKLKYRQLYRPKDFPYNDPNFRYLEMPDGTRRPMTTEERNGSAPLPKGAKIFRYDNITSPGKSQQDDSFEFEGKVFNPGANLHWKTSLAGMRRLKELNRIAKVGSQLAQIRYFDDFPLSPLHNIWSDTSTGGFGDDRLYVVQTTQKTIERCLLMVTDPGDIVLDPTCGSGTTAAVAEKWGRRWITCDTSRVAITLAKQRLMTAKFDFYELAHPKEGLNSGFKYNTVKHITLGTIANDQQAKEETLFDQPSIDKDKVRVSGPFTVEAVPSLRVKPFEGKEPTLYLNGNQLARSGETGDHIFWSDELKASGIRATGNKFITFSRIEPMLGTKFLHARADILEDELSKKCVISFGPAYGPLEQRQVEEAINEARKLKDKPDFIIFTAFHFDPEAAKDIDLINWPGVTILKAQMSVDLLTSDLRKKRSSNQSYWLIGQPDVELVNNKDGTYKVKVHGFDYYNPISGEIESGGSNRIAMWFLDTDYDERSIFPDQVFFPTGDSKRDWTRVAKALNGKVDEDLMEAFAGIESLPFTSGEHKKVAVKIIDDRGIESFVIKPL